MQHYFNASGAEKSAIKRWQTIIGQLRTNKVTDENILEAFQSVPREAFLKDEYRDYSYIDRSFVCPVETKQPEDWRVMFEPMITARLLQVAHLKPSDHVMVLPGYLGYTAALIGQLVDTVYSVEMDENLTDQARQLLKELHYDNVAAVTVDDVTQGYKAKAPFDAIFLEGVVENVPETLLHQLREGGRLMCAVGDDVLCTVTVLRRQGTDFTPIQMFETAAPALPGLRKASAVFEF